MIHSQLSSKAQTTIPRAIRETLGLKGGDTLVYTVEDGRVVISRAMAGDPFENPFAMFTEWADEADCEAFKDL